MTVFKEKLKLLPVFMKFQMQLVKIVPVPSSLYLITWIWILFITLVQVVHGDGMDCLSMQQELIQTTACIGLSEKSESSTSLSAITKEEWKQRCIAYHTSIHCLRTLPKSCSGDNQVERNTEEMLTSTFGKICQDDTKSFKIYQNHIDCYKKYEYDVARCSNKTAIVIMSVMNSYGNGFSEQAKTTVCSSFNELIVCTRSALKQCVEEASSLYISLTKAQVPKQFAAICQLSETSDTSSASTHLLHISTVIVVLGFHTIWIY